MTAKKIRVLVNGTCFRCFSHDFMLQSCLITGQLNIFGATTLSSTPSARKSSDNTQKQLKTVISPCPSKYPNGTCFRRWILFLTIDYEFI